MVNHEEQVDRQSNQQFIEVVVKDRDFKKFHGLRWFLVTYKGVDPGMAVQILTIENLGGVLSRCFKWNFHSFLRRLCGAATHLELGRFS